MKVESQPSGAKVWVDGTYRGETPLTVSVERGIPHTVKLTADGHEEAAVQTGTRLDGSYVVLDIIFSAGLFLLVDAVTGAWYSAGPEPLRVIMSPTGQDCSTGSCAYLVTTGEEAEESDETQTAGPAGGAR